MIRLLICDCDGTLTDGTVYVSERGEEMLAFHRRDGHAFQLAREAGIRVVILTGEDSPIVRKRAEKLGVRVVGGCKDKAAALASLAVEYDVRLAEIAYIGDDVNDVVAMRMVRDRGGIIGCPLDGVDAVRNLGRVMSTYGGRGAVREFVETLLRETRREVLLCPKCGRECGTAEVCKCGNPPGPRR